MSEDPNPTGTDLDTQTDEPTEHTIVLDGPTPFLAQVFETIDAHISRTGEEYGDIITGVNAEESGDIDHDEEAILYVYTLGGVDPDEALESVDLALDRIADEQDMVLARQSVRLTLEDDGDSIT
jgi:hypothetical protein